MSIQQAASIRSQVRLALEVSIYVGLVILLVTSCFLILRPFIPLLAWGIIIAVAAYPGFQKIQSVLGGRDVIAAVLCTIIFLALLLLPIVLLAQSLVHGFQGVAAILREGTSIVPPPPPNIEKWPIIGARLNSVWALASKNLTEAINRFAPQINSILASLVSTSAGVGLTVLELLLSILIGGFLLANAQPAQEITLALAKRIFGDQGPEFEKLIVATIRSVTTGILGVAVIQAVFATLGFFLVGLPAAGIWTVAFIFAAVVQVGVLVLIPAVIYVFAVASVTKAVIFMAWCVLVGLMDNVLKPLLLGRGVAVPIAVVFLGAIGGFMAMGVIGLFVGAIVLSVGYKVFLAWLYRGTATA